MKKPKLLRYKKILNNTWISWLVATLLFFGATFAFLGPSITDCSTATASFNTDTTGGLGWAQWASGNGPNWTYSTKSNFPVGEPLNKPQDITSAAFNAPYRILATVSTPTCGLNLMTVIGFMSNALIMFGLVRWLFRRNSIALFAGYAASFTPYHLLKSQSHVPYVFSSMFIAIVWLYLWYRQQPSVRRLAPLAVVTAASFYFNGYYILLTASLVAALCLWSVAEYGLGYYRSASSKKSEVKRQLLEYIKHMVALGVMLCLLLAPLALMQIRSSKTIEQSLSAARGDINNEAQIYSARLPEYVLPAYNNPLLPSSYKEWRLAHQHQSNPTEDTLYVGLTVAALSTVGLWAALKHSKRKTLLRDNISYRQLVFGLLIVLAVTVALSLPPRFVAFGHNLYSPTFFVLKITESWRVFARFILISQFIFVLLAASGLYILSKTVSRRWFYAITIASFVAIFLEFLPARLPIESGDIIKNTPELYHTVAHDDSIRSLAEYPIMDYAYAPSLFTFQQVHGKPLLNANSPAVNQSELNKSIGGVKDEQTIGVLKSIGIDLVTSRGVRLDGTPGLVPMGTNPLTNLPADVYAYRTAGVVGRPYALVASNGFSYFSVDDKQISHRVLKSSGNLLLHRLGSQPSGSAPLNISFQAAPLEQKKATVSIYQNDVLVWQGEVTNTDTAVRFSTNSNAPLDIRTSSAIDVINLSATQHAE